MMAPRLAVLLTMGRRKNESGMNICGPVGVRKNLILVNLVIARSTALAGIHG